MASEPRWLTSEEVEAIAREEVAETGETYFLRDHGLLEMACARPMNLFAYEGEEDMVTLATALLLGIARNHPFEQGNKRTAFVAAAMFLSLNGYLLDPPDTVFAAEVVIGAIIGKGSEEEFTEMFREWVRSIRDPALGPE